MHRGDIYLVDLEPTRGAEARNRRPAVNGRYRWAASGG
ncbi:MAG: type II toxin-antitoxin system PemK/MazF family toxin [Chloroflexota bacterium]